MRAYVSGRVVYCETWMDATYKGENHANGTGLKTATSRAVEICRDEYNKWYYNGILFDVRIYNRALTANEIAEIYHKRGADRVWQGLVGRWRLDEFVTGASVRDLSGNGNHGTPYNSPVYQASPHRLRRGVLVS